MSATEKNLSAASKHALALTRLQGHEPTAQHIELLARVDSGELTPDQAIQEILAHWSGGSNERVR